MKARQIVSNVWKKFEEQKNRFLARSLRYTYNMLQICVSKYIVFFFQGKTWS